MNKDEIDGLLKKVKRKLKMNGRFKANFKNEITSKYLRGL